MCGTHERSENGPPADVADTLGGPPSRVLSEAHVQSQMELIQDPTVPILLRTAALVLLLLQIGTLVACLRISEKALS